MAASVPRAFADDADVVRAPLSSSIASSGSACRCASRWSVRAPTTPPSIAGKLVAVGLGLVLVAASRIPPARIWWVIAPTSRGRDRRPRDYLDLNATREGLQTGSRRGIADEGQAEDRPEHGRCRRRGRGVHGRGAGRNAGTRPRTEGCAWRLSRRPARRTERASCGRRSPRWRSRTGPWPSASTRSSRPAPLTSRRRPWYGMPGLCQPGRQGRLLLPGRFEVQGEVRDVRLPARRQPRRRGDVADRLRPRGADARRRGTDRRAREEGRELRIGPARRILTPAQASSRSTSWSPNGRRRQAASVIGRHPQRPCWAHRRSE